MTPPKFHSVAFAILTMAALILAPVCAPLCSARACQSENFSPIPHISESHCHGEGESTKQDSQFHASRHKGCSAAEYQAILSSTKNEESASGKREKAQVRSDYENFTCAGRLATINRSFQILYSPTFQEQCNSPSFTSDVLRI